MGLKKAEHGQRDGTGGQERVDGRKPAGEAGGLDAAARFVFAEAQLRHAVAEERREALLHVKPPSVHLAKVQDEICRDAPMSAGEGVKIAEQGIVGEGGERWSAGRHDR
jgi:hypothetical protein